eukprot:PhF_6_TR19260/c0_g1_i1/m.28311
MKIRLQRRNTEESSEPKKTRVVLKKHTIVTRSKPHATPVPRSRDSSPEAKFGCCVETPETYDFKLQCEGCGNWIHNTCASLKDKTNLPPNFLCRTCVAASAGSIKIRKRHRTEMESIPQVIKECGNNEKYLQLLEEYVSSKLGCEVRSLGPCVSSEDSKQCYEACQEAITNGTFSQEYPRHCLKQLATNSLTNCTVLVDRSEQRIVAWIFTNARDDISNFKATISALRTLNQRHPEVITSMMEQFLSITNFEEYFHVSILATHSAHRGKGYGKVLLLHAMLFWSLRGITKAFLNMALEKHFDTATERWGCRPSPASHSLYTKFGFTEVYPKYTSTGRFRWTSTEADMGRLMINPNVSETIETMTRLFAFDPSKVHHDKAEKIS